MPSYELSVVKLSNAAFALKDVCSVNPTVFAGLAADAPAAAKLNDQTLLVKVSLGHTGAARYLCVTPCPHTEPDQIGTSSIQRKALRWAFNDQLSVTAAGAGALPAAVGMDIHFKVLAPQGVSRPQEIDASVVAERIRQIMLKHPVQVGHAFAMKVSGPDVQLTLQADVVKVLLEEEVETAGPVQLWSSTDMMLKCEGASLHLKGAKSKKLFKGSFNFAEMGIGGLDEEFQVIFRDAFMSRMLPPDLVERMGLPHVKGMVLYGAPGCGKTLIARQLGKILQAREPKVVNGPEILNKYVGQSEENIRELFADAEQDEQENGTDSDLHIIIFDEIDAICKRRGTTGGGTGVNDSVVNQLLSKIDGVKALNNVLIIGMTNRLDMLDDALLRPGRLELKIEIGLPDAEGRAQILSIHTSKLKKEGFLGEDVNLEELAEETANYTGAELKGVVMKARAMALSRVHDPAHPEELDVARIQITQEDFKAGIESVVPAFGAVEDDLAVFYNEEGIVPWGDRWSSFYDSVQRNVQQVARPGARIRATSMLLVGATGSGKSAASAYTAVQSGFPFAKRLGPDMLIGADEVIRAGAIAGMATDSLRSSKSVIVLDDLERLIDYVPVGQRYSNTVLQAIVGLCKAAPPGPGHCRVVLATVNESALPVMEAMGLRDLFDVVVHVPEPETAAELQPLLTMRGDMEAAVAAKVASRLSGMAVRPPLKRLLRVLDLARGSTEDGTTDIAEEAVEQALLDSGFASM